VGRVSRFFLLLSTLLLLAVVAYFVASVFWQLMEEGSPGPSGRAVAAANVDNNTLQPVLPDIHFQYHERSPVIGSNIPEISLKGWVLKGTYLDEDGSIAIIATPEKTYVVEENAHLGQVATVVEIRPYGVVLAMAGAVGSDQRLRQIVLQDRTIASVYESTVGFQSTRKNNTGSLSLSPSTNTDSFGNINFRPLRQHGRMVLVVTIKKPAKHQVSLQHSSLQNGDKIVLLEGRKLTTRYLEKFFNKIQKGQKTRVKIERNGKIKDILVQF